MQPATPGGRRWSLLSHLLALVVIVAAVTVAVGGYFTVQGYDEARRRASDQLRGTVDLAARAIAQDLEEAVAQARAVAPTLAPAVISAAAAGVSLADACQLSYSPRPVFPQGDQHILDAAGAVSCTSRRAAIGTPYGGEPWFAGLAGGQPVVASLPQDPVTGEPAVAVALVLTGPDGRPVGYSLTVMATRPVASTLAGIYRGPARYAFVVADDGGRTLSSSSDPTSTGRRAPRVGEGDTARDPGGTERIYSSSRVPVVSWEVLGGVSRSAALAPARDELQRRGIMTAASLAALLLLAVAVHRRFLRPVRARSAVSLRARNDRGLSAPTTGPAELAGLAGDLNAMLAARDRAEAELAALARALEASGRVIVEAGEQERIQLGTRLHDGPIQDMIVTSWALEDAAGQLPPGALAEVRRRLEGAIEACRAIESDLRPPKLVDAGVSDAVEELAARRRADSPFTIEVIDELDGARFALHTELLIFRSVQEALRLLRQQSGATTVTITLRSEGGTLTALVADDGAGARTGDDPVPPEAASGPYAGAAMRDPVLLAGGRYQTGPGPEGGRELRIDVPATSRDHDR